MDQLLDSVGLLSVDNEPDGQVVPMAARQRLLKYSDPHYQPRTQVVSCPDVNSTKCSTSSHDSEQSMSYVQHPGANILVSSGQGNKFSPLTDKLTWSTSLSGETVENGVSGETHLLIEPRQSSTSLVTPPLAASHASSYHDLDSETSTSAATPPPSTVTSSLFSESSNYHLNSHSNRPLRIASCVSVQSALSTSSSDSSLSDYPPNTPICKFCHQRAKAHDPLISPCHCKGTIRFMHCRCLMVGCFACLIPFDNLHLVSSQKWLDKLKKRNSRHHPLSCEICKYEYQWRKKFKVSSKWTKFLMRPRCDSLGATLPLSMSDLVAIMANRATCSGKGEWPS